MISCVNKCNKAKKNTSHSRFLEIRRLERVSKVSPQIHCIENPEIFKKIRESIVGGPSIVFHRLLEAGKTKVPTISYDEVTKQYHVKVNGETVQCIVGYDATGLYLSCVGQELPCGPLAFDTREISLSKILTEVLENDFFGFVEVDIHVPEHLKGFYAMFPPIFKNVEIPFETIGEFMQQHFKDCGEWTGNGEDPRRSFPKGKGRRRLISSMFANKMLLFTPLMKFYLKHDLVVTKTYARIRARPGRPFKKFMEDVARQRREADADASKSVNGLMMKVCVCVSVCVFVCVSMFMCLR